MKSKILLVALASAFLLVSAAPNLWAKETNPLVERLKEKGILTPSEASELNKEMKKEAEAFELPSWVKKIKFSGDFRLRYQPQGTDRDDGSTDYRSRFRYRWRFGAKLQANEQWLFGFRLASGGSDPRSTNQTLTNDFEIPDARLDRAYVQYQPVKPLKFVGGQFKNPLWQAKDLLWDSDINPMGAAAQLKVRANETFTLFLTPAWFVLQESKHGQGTPNMVAVQPGFTLKPNKFVAWTLSFTGYMNNNLEGHSFKYGSGTNSVDANGNLTTEYSSVAADSALEFFLDGSFLSYVAFQAQFVQSDADSDDRGWLAGFRIGHKKVKGLGDWQVWYNYRELEKDAWPDFLPDSDFYNGETNVKGHNASLRIGLAKHVWLDVEYYRTQILDVTKSNDPISTDRPQFLWQFDLNVKF